MYMNFHKMEVGVDGMLTSTGLGMWHTAWHITCTQPTRLYLQHYSLVTPSDVVIDFVLQFKQLLPKYVAPNNYVRQSGGATTAIPTKRNNATLGRRSTSSATTQKSPKKY